MIRRPGPGPIGRRRAQLWMLQGLPRIGPSRAARQDGLCILEVET